MHKKHTTTYRKIRRIAIVNSNNGLNVHVFQYILICKIQGNAKEKVFMAVTQFQRKTAELFLEHQDLQLTSAGTLPTEPPRQLSRLGSSITCTCTLCLPILLLGARLLQCISFSECGCGLDSASLATEKHGSYTRVHAVYTLYMYACILHVCVCT